MKKFSHIKIIITAILAVIFLVALVQTARIYSERKEAESVYSELQELVSPEESTSNETQSPETDPPNTEETETPEAAPIEVDFAGLTSQYPDVVGWIYSEGTEINYPVAQGKDNNQYLRHLLSGKYNTSGTIFVDYRNGEVGTDDNYVIYGHNMKNSSMFGSLVKYKKQSYYDEHPYLYFLTPEKSYKIELIAGMVTLKTSNAYSVNFENAEQLEAYIASAIKKSTFKSNVAYTPGDKLVTLSTCSYEYDNARYVVIGVLK